MRAASRHDRHVSAAGMSSNSERKLKASASPSLKQRCAGEKSRQRGGRGWLPNAAANSCCRRAFLRCGAMPEECAAEADAAAGVEGGLVTAVDSSSAAAALAQLRSLRFRGAEAAAFLPLMFADSAASQ